MSSAGSRNDRTSGVLRLWQDPARPVPFVFPFNRAEIKAGPGTVFAGGHHGRVASQPTPARWAASVLDGLGIRQSPGAVQALVGWARAEGGHWHNDARYNPLNTTQPEPGAGNTGTQGNIKVYRSWGQGVDATVKTLRNGRYGGILSALRAGDPARVASAIGNSPWGTSASLARSAILGTPRSSGSVQPLGGGSSGSSPASALVNAAGGSSSPSPSFGPANDVSGAVAALLSSARSSGPPVSGPMLPAHAAHAVMPQGYTPVASAPPVSTAPDVQALMDAVRTQGGSVPGAGGPSGSQTVNGGSGATSVSGAGGDVRVAPGANRPGVGLTPGVVKLVRAVSATAGHPLTIGTGTNHNRMTVDGNVSDHWSGNAADLPTTPGAENIQLGREALAALGVPRSQAAKAQGGIYNIPYGQHRRIQVIFNTNAGGNHHNHVHVGVTAK